jgi:two-component system, OmpR family, response regulator CpxR
MISSYPTPKRTILCIDDDDAILRYEKALLERSGYAVLTAASAQQGLRLVTMCKCDAVLLDYEMPEMNGHEVAVEIKRVRPELMVILLSGTEVPTQALALVDAFVPKLEASQQLLPMIAEICSRSENAPRTTTARDSGARPSPASEA